MRICIYTDGACKGNPGIGGWGALLILGESTPSKQSNSVRIALKGAAMRTTNNRMEMMAAIRALESIEMPSKVDLHTDSVYLKDGITKWLAGWQKNGWRTRGKQEVKNKDLWLLLLSQTQRHEVEFFWVKGHAGNEGNERADALANEAIEQIKQHAQRNAP